MRSSSIALTDSGHLEVDAQGQLVLDGTPATRVRTRLLVERGSYWADPELGLEQLKMADSDTRVAEKVVESLQPLLDSGDLESVEVAQVERNHGGGYIAVELDIALPGGDALELGALPLRAV